VAAPALIVEAAVRSRNRLPAALARLEDLQDVGTGADAPDAAAGRALVVEAAVRAADGSAAAALGAGGGEGC
jgi:hypothetical protein